VPSNLTVGVMSSVQLSHNLTAAITLALVLYQAFVWVRRTLTGRISKYPAIWSPTDQRMFKVFQIILVIGTVTVLAVVFRSIILSEPFLDHGMIADNVVVQLRTALGTSLVCVFMLTPRDWPTGSYFGLLFSIAIVFSVLIPD
jgi:hypothetical protein